MTNFYFNLNQIQSNPDGEPTVSRQSRLMSTSGEKNKKEQLSRDCLSLASELPLTCLRPDTVSFACRCRVLDTPRYISAAFSTRVWKHVAMIFAVLVMSIANIGVAWGAEYSGTVTFYRTGGTLTTSTITNDNANVTFTFSDLAANGSSTKICNVSSRYGIKGKNQTLITVTCPSGYYFKSAQFKLGSFGASETPTAAIYTGSTRLYQCSAHTYTKLDASTCGDVFSCEDSITNFVSSKYTTLSVKETGNSKNLTVLYLDYTIAPTDGGDPTPSTYTVTYDGNGKTGGSVPTDSNSPYEENDEVTVLGNTSSLVKTNYTFTGWNTAADGSGTHYDADDTFTMGTSNVTLYAEWALDLTLHTPGKYTTAQGSGGYGASLNTYDSRDYEVYYVSYNSSKLSICAGNLAYNASGHYNVIDNVSTSAGVTYFASDGWFAIAANSYGNSGTVNTGQFNVNASRHKASLRESNKITLRVSGYDQFAFYGKDYNAGSGNANQLVVKIDGVTQSYTHNTTDNTIFSFDITTGEHTIQISTAGGSNDNRVGGFSLRIPAAACTAPNHVDISGRWDRFGGETISLTATAYSSAGTGSPIADGDITGWQWEKLVGSTWTPLSNGTVDGVTTSGATTKNLQITNCGQGNSGKYRCVVSTGATCSTASATATDGSEGYIVKVYALECYTGGTTVYNFTRDGNNQRGSVEIALTASTGYQFKIHADKYYGNDGTINFDENNWTFTAAGNNVTVNSGLGGTFTFTIDYSSNGDVPVLAVTYPRKRIYLSPGVWDAEGAKFAYYYFHKDGDDTDAEGWTGFLTNNDCGMYADIPQWNGVKIIAARLNSSTVTPGSWDDRWNQTGNLTVTSNDYIVVNNWDNITYNSTYSTPTYTISYAKGTPAASIDGSKADETKTCGVDFTLPNSAVFTRTGYTQTGWAISDGGSLAYALGGTYTTNEDKTFYPVWTVNNYDLTWNLAGGTTTSAGTGIGSGVSSNTTTSQAFGTALTAPTVTKTGYNFSAWSPAVASTMPAANTTYTAQWTVKTTTITIDANTSNHGSTAPSPITATYGSALPSFTAAAGVSGYSLTGYFTTATSGTKIINADGTLVASTDYADGSGNWKYETATLTLYAQYEEEGCTPTTASITFNNNVAGKYNTAWVAGDITTSGGATYSLTNCSVDNDHPMTKPAIKGAKNKTLIQINIPAGATSGTISVSAATYSGGGATLAITNSSGTVLASQSLASTTTNADAGSWSAPTLKTASYNITSGGTYYIKETSNTSNIYIYAFSATGSIPCCDATPDAPTSPSNGATGSTTQAVSWTDAGNDKWEVYVSTSSSTPGGSQTPTASPTTASYTFEDLTASTQYYWWVRSVCDADHKSSWVAGTSFTTSAPAVLTAMECNTLYKVGDMVPSGYTLTSDEQYGAGLSANTYFETLGDPSKTSSAGGAPEMKNISSVTIDGTSFGAAMYLKRAAEISSSLPTSHAVKFIVSESAKLIMYVKRSDRLYLIKEGGSAQSLGSSDSNEKVEKDITAGTYYIYANNTNTVVYGLNLQCCTTPADPDGLAAGSITGTTATFTITDDETPASYDIYYSTSSTAPTSGTAATATTTTTSKLVEGLTPNTTYYAWVRAVCDASHKSDWVALTGTTFATLAAYDVDFTLTNVSYSSGDNEGTNAATSGVAFSTVFAASSGYSLPGTITVTIGGSPATLTTDYTWNQGTGTLTILAASVTDDISVTIVGEELEGDGCEDLVSTEAATATSLSTSVGTATLSNPSSQSKNSKAIKLNSSGYIELSPKAGKSFAAGDSLIVVVYNQATSGKTTGFKIGSDTYTASIAKESNHTFRQKLTGDNIVSSKVKIERESSDGWFVSIIIKHCEDLPSCTTPTLPSLEDQTVCPGSDIAAWNAEPTNIATITGASEDVAYSWKKKGSDTELAATASFDLGSSATEGMAGTYVVTVTVSKTGYISKSASAEVELSVTAAVEEPVITSNKATVYPGNSVTLTATCGTDGVTWNWYLCANADGTGAGSSLGTSSSYTIASAPAAGTYYYKAVATGTCGSAEHVYTLTVSAAAGGDCETEFWFAYDSDRPEGAAAATHITTALTAGSTASASITIDGNTYAITKRSSNSTGPVTIVIPEGNTGTVYVLINGSNSRSLTLTKGGVSQWSEVPVGWTSYSITGLDEGTYTLSGSGNLGWGLVALKLCSAVACTDPEVTASADNTTACVGTSVTFTAANAHASATYQWQRLDGTWTNISGATSATYTIDPVAAEDETKYRVIASHDCNRTSNEVTLNVVAAPVFGDVPASVSIMQTLALSISTVEASDAVSYKWYKSADATWDAGDTEIGTDKTLIKAYADEAIGSPSYYVFCRAQNSCGITTSSAIAVNVTTYVEEDCATKGNEGEAEFGFENTGCSDGSIESTACYTSNSRSKYLTYTAPDGKYFNKAKVTVAVSSGSKCGYAYSTDGSTWTYAELTGLSGTLTEKTIELTGNITHFRISRNLQDGSSVDHGVTSGTFYLSKACFEYTESCTATEVVRSTGSASYDYTYPAAFAKPTFALQKASDHSALAGTLTYSSSNEDIATVDDDGDVDFTGLTGTVTITVAFAGGTISTVDYCASQTTYTITVNCSDVQPKITTSGSSITCQASITLNAVQQSGSAFADGTFQWYRDGVEIEGATSASYTATRAGIYTVSRTATCTKMSSNSANITNDNTEPEVTRLTPFQYYHVDSVYRATSIMRYRHLFTVKGSTAYGSTGKNFKMELSRNGGDAVDVTTQSSIVVTHSADNTVDTVLLDLNALKDKYTENDELVLTCKAIACGGAVSETYKESITVYVINKTKPTMALICSGAKKDGTGTRKTSEMTVGGDFLTGYNPADLCQQTGNTSFDASQEWGLYTKLKENYIVTPVNGYANFYKLNYEPFDILFLTDYPKASKSDAAATILDDMADLCDYRPLFSFKTHMVHKTPSKWVAKGFTTAPEVPKNSRLRLNIVCYAHPMFEDLKTASATNQILHDADDGSQLVYTMLREAGYEKKDNVKKGIQGFEIDAAENFVTIGLVHYNATAADSVPDNTHVTWTPGSGDRLLVAAAERQANLEARMILFSLNAGAHSKLNTTGENVVLKCLEYLLTDAEVIAPADCSLTFDNNGGSGDGLWSTATNWAPNRLSYPGRFNSARIAAPVTVDMEHAEALELRIVEGGSVTIPAGKALEVTSTVRRMDGHEISPTENEDIFIGSNSTGNGTLIFNNNTGDSKATVAMYTTAKTADPDPVTGKISAAASTWQYIGTPHNDVAVATYNYYDSWLYQYDTDTEGWTVIPNGGPLVPFRGYCVTHPEANHTFVMGGKLTATTSQEIAIPAGKFVVVANSWTAPIYVKNITAEDMENTREQTIYFFNTGSDSEQTGTVANGTYVAVPVHSSPYTGDSLISSMQGFYVVGGSSDGTLHLDYERHVRPTNNRNIKSGPMHAPQHYAVDDEPIVAKLFFRGSRYSDRLVVLERADFSRGFDNGWDGEAWGGNDAAPYSCVSGENRWDAVSAIPDFEGTVVGFQAGEDNEYRIDFEYSEENEPLYLLDTDNNTYTRVLTGNTYQFTTSDKDYHDRFLFTRKAPQVATGYENLEDGSGAKAKKLLIGDKMYIMLNGMLYDATGKVVK